MRHTCGRISGFQFKRNDSLRIILLLPVFKLHQHGSVNFSLDPKHHRPNVFFQFNDFWNANGSLFCRWIRLFAKRSARLQLVLNEGVNGRKSSQVHLTPTGKVLHHFNDLVTDVSFVTVTTENWFNVSLNQGLQILCNSIRICKIAAFKSFFNQFVNNWTTN